MPTAPPDPAAFVRATHAVADLAAGLHLFERLLGGRVVARGAAPGGAWVFADVVWPQPPRLRLVAPPTEGSPATSTTAPATTDLPVPLLSWLGALPGRLHHLAFAADAPRGEAARAERTAVDDGVGTGERGGRHDTPGVLPSDRAWRLIEPEHNLGTRLVMVTGAGTLDRE